MRTCTAFISTMLVTLIVPSVARASAAYRIGQVSQQTSPSHATAGASVEVSTRQPGAPGGSQRATAPAASGAQSPAEPEAATVADEGSSPGSTASQRPATTCEIRWVPPCAIPPPEAAPQPAAAGPARPALNPTVVAERVAARVSLAAGTVDASPRAEGWTGAASWFWLAPAPTTHTVSASLDGERVTVSASVASVRWSFGDGASLTGGPGVAYRPGAAPADAVQHVYQTRCLPGDQGHDPNVLPSCGPDGYTVSATVQWSIGYTASGPIGGGGALPSRSTSTSIAYPVSEARAFLTSTGGGA